VILNEFVGDESVDLVSGNERQSSLNDQLAIQRDDPAGNAFPDSP
jgi:hypothetical protein